MIGFGADTSGGDATADTLDFAGVDQSIQSIENSSSGYEHGTTDGDLADDDSENKHDV